MSESTTAGSPPVADDAVRPSGRLDRTLAALSARKQEWADLPIERRIDYLERLRAGLLKVARGQVAAAVEAKGGRPAAALAAEEWVAGPYINLRTTRLLLRTLEQIRDRGAVALPPATLRERPGGGVAVRVFPTGAYDRLLYSGFTADVWMQPAVTRRSLGEHVGMVYRRERREGRVALVLGAGNVASIGPLDAVHKLFAEGQSVLLKLNPVNDYLGPFIEDAFAPLVEDGFFAVVAGGAETGAYLCEHPLVDEIHVTGSAATHDAIVFGTGAEGDERKRQGRPRLDKRITSELGNVSPVIVVPGDWSDADLRFQAQNVATQMVQNGGFNCNAAKVLVTHRDWPQREAFLDRLGEVLADLPRRDAYYPGAGERFERFRRAYPQARLFGDAEGGALPAALAVGVDSGSRDELAFTTESFCSFTAETPLGGDSSADFLERAVELCNERLYGTLNAGLLVHPATRRALGDRLDAAVAGLRYGTVAINHWPALAYGLGSTPWGAYPGHTAQDIQSGTSVVHNAFLLEDTEKTVVDGPFRVFPKPVWFVTHRAAHRVGPYLARLEADGSPAHLPFIFWHALRG